MSKKEQYDRVAGVLKWMVAEGMVKKVGDKYRLKTEKEIKEDLESILAD